MVNLIASMLIVTLMSRLPQLKRDVKRLGLKRYKRRAHKAISPEPSVVDDSRNDGEWTKTPLL